MLKIYLLALCGLVFQAQAQTPYLVKDVHQSTTFNYGPKSLTDVNGTLFFAGTDQTFYNILWKSDGTESGTVVVKEVYIAGNGGEGIFTHVNGTLFFSAFDSLGSVNEELWKSDGTAAGTVRVLDINPGPESGIGYDFNMISYNGIGYFTANDGVHGVELWRTNGTAAGTYMIKDIFDGPTGSFPTHLIVMNGTLFFFADNGVNGVELWRTDGTAAGTLLTKDIIPGAVGVSIQPAFTQVNGTMFFCVYKGINMYELWKSNGTDAGTSRVTHGNGLFAFGNPIMDMASFNNELYFTTGGVVDLWKSDGTDAGTSQLTYLFKGSSFAGAGNLINATSTLLFTGADNAFGSELWKSNGTLNNSILLKDIRTGPASSSPGGYLHVNGTTYFNAQDGINGTEVWKTNGAAAGTEALAQINPGAGFATPAEFTLSGNRVFFTADDGVRGTELWALDLTTSTEVPGGYGPSVLTLAPNPAINELTVTSSSDHFTESFRITNLAGQMVMEGRLTGQTSILNISQLMTGVYFIQTGNRTPVSFQVTK